MNKLEVLEELLPGFQQFLTDLTTCRLSSALETQVTTYNQNIEDYISQNYSMPMALPPDPPAAVNGVLDSKTDAFIAEQRELSRLSQLQTVSKDDSYYNVSVGTTKSTDARFDNLYENPSAQKSPPVPSTTRPLIRNIQDDPDFYEEPDSVPVIKASSKSATMPLPSKQGSIEPEGSDSGGTFISFQSSSSSQQHDDMELYEDLPDVDNFDNEDTSTSYDSYDEEEIEKNKTINTDSNANKTKRKQDEKSDKDKLALFRKKYENDSAVQQVGILHMPKKGITISKKSFGPWNKRYCVARDMHLLGFKKCDSKEPTFDYVLFGNAVAFVGQDGKQQNVFSVAHPNRGTEMFSAGSREEADKWIEVLEAYATMGNELVPSTGFVAEEGPTLTANTGDDITKKLIKIFKREKKTMAPQLSIDDKGVLSGYINVLGAKYGDSKWRKKFVTIDDGVMALYSEDGDTLQFDFPLVGTEMSPADPKITRRKVAMRICRGEETLIYVQFFNHLDMGPLLQVYTKILVDPKKGTTTPKQRGMVTSILKAFEKQNSDVSDQGTYDEVDEKTGRRYVQEKGLYENTLVSLFGTWDGLNTSPVSTQEAVDSWSPDTFNSILGLMSQYHPSPTKFATHLINHSAAIFVNFPAYPVVNSINFHNTEKYINVARVIDEDLYLELLDDSERSPPPQTLKAEKKQKKQFVAMQAMPRVRRKSFSTPGSPKLTKKAPVEPAVPDSGKKDKKNKKEKKDKKDKKGKGAKEEAVAKEEEVAKEPEVAVEPVKRRQLSVINKFKESDKSHLMVVDQLEIERKEVDGRKRAATKLKIDLRVQKRETTDPKRKEQLEAELGKAQHEWSECSNRLTSINNEIERLNKGNDTSTLREQKQQFRMSMVRELSFKDPMMVRRTRDRLSLCAMRSWSLDTASAEMVRSSISETSRKERRGANSPGREVAQQSVGNVQDKLKMFQDMGKK